MADERAEAGEARRVVGRLALEAGFHEVRFAKVRATPRSDSLDRWLARGEHADLHWMPRGRQTRVDVRERHPWAKTALVLGVHHHHVAPPDPGGRTGRVARYAWGRDYHNVLGRRLKRLRARLGELGVRAWGGVDTAPILERAWAEAAGMGGVGKNTMLLVPGRGSFLLLGVLFLDVEVEPDTPGPTDVCGRCTRCLVACPTAAFPEPHVLDARRCISYWTIEARGLPPAELRPGFGRWLFGCDGCQEVCPHGHHPPDPDEDAFRPVNAWVDLDELLALPDAAVLDRFEGTPLRRPGAVGLKRNASIVLGNMGDPGAVPALRTHGLTHPSPVVRGAAVWALSRLGERVASSDDEHPLVRAEAEACTPR